MRDIVIVASVVIAFALFATAHVAITYGLMKREPRWRAAAAFVALPLAPFWAWREHMRVRAGLWLGAFAVYVVARIVASR